MASQGVTLVGDADDDERSYTLEEDERLCASLFELTKQTHEGRYDELPIDERLLCDLHRRLFTGVRGHGGRHRSPVFGSEYLIFGGHRSVHRSRVPAELRDLFHKLERFLRSFRDNEADPEYESRAFHVAVWAHAELVRIHPFEDGNGRTSRLVLDMVLVRLGLRPVAIEAVKNEYLVCMDIYMTRNGEIQALIDLYLRLADAALAETYS